jgi:hypothetical protein
MLCVLGLSGCNDTALDLPRSQVDLGRADLAARRDE